MFTILLTKLVRVVDSLTFLQAYDMCGLHVYIRIGQVSPRTEINEE